MYNDGVRGKEADGVEFFDARANIIELPKRLIRCLGIIQGKKRLRFELTSFGRETTRLTMEAKRGWDRCRAGGRGPACSGDGAGSLSLSLLCCRAPHLPRQAIRGIPCPSAVFSWLSDSIYLLPTCSAYSYSHILARASCESCGNLLRTEWYKYDAAWCKPQHPILHVSKSEVLR